LKVVDRDMLVVLSSHTTVALAATSAVTDAELEAAQLRAALATRDVIGQAKGILTQRRGVGADEAFDILRTASQHLNIKLAEVAGLLASKRDDLLKP
jgi:AmiR/NasT family two-component response regulator